MDLGTRPSPSVIVVVPAFRVEQHISNVLARMPSIVREIIAVEDSSPDSTGQVLDRLASADSRLVVIHHEKNAGVGGAVKTGYREALRRHPDVVVKLDGDGQMNPDYIAQLVAPILAGEAEYTKGNRFHDWGFLQSMPVHRKIGNLGLSFLIKIASGYWNVFDPTNGYTAISSATLRKLHFDRLAQRYLFESSMLIELYTHNARIKQVAMPAIYDGAVSSLSIARSLVEFPTYLLRATLRRFMQRYIWQDFTAVSVFVILGLGSLTFGTVFGAYQWMKSLQTMQPATAGTVMLSAMPVILGFQLLLEAIVLDIQNAPK